MPCVRAARTRCRRRKNGGRIRSPRGSLGQGAPDGRAALPARARPRTPRPTAATPTLRRAQNIEPLRPCARASRTHAREQERGRPLLVSGRLAACRRRVRDRQPPLRASHALASRRVDTGRRVADRRRRKRLSRSRAIRPRLPVDPFRDTRRSRRRSGDRPRGDTHCRRSGRSDDRMHRPPIGGERRTRARRNACRGAGTRATGLDRIWLRAAAVSDRRVSERRTAGPSAGRVGVAVAEPASSSLPGAESER